MRIGESEARTLARERTVLALLFFATAVNYLDRQTLSVAAPLLHQQLGITSLGYSRIVFAFLLGYTISQTLAGKLIDRIGTRLGMLLCVVLWSAVTMLHSLAVGALSLGILRTCLGLTEAGNWPGGVKAVSENFPAQRRAFATGVFNSGSAAGAIVAPPLVAVIMRQWGWRVMFAVVGILGFLWALVWAKQYQPRLPGWGESPVKDRERSLPFALICAKRRCGA